MLFYIITFVLGFWLDSNNIRKVFSSKMISTFRNIYLLWLYIFLCFGYMTGSDWRSYELEYNSNTDIGNSTELASRFIFNNCPLIISDFWVFFGLFKCLYLFSVQRVVKKISSKWLSVLSMLLPGSLMFMLIDNPFRYMLALIVINFAVIFLLEKKYLLYFVIGIISIFFHSTALIPLLLFFLINILPNRIFDIKSSILVPFYILFTLLMSSLSNVSFFQEYIYSIFLDFGFKDYSVYTAEDNSSFFTIGNLLTLFTGIILILSRTEIKYSFKYGSIVVKMILFSVFFQKLCLMIPTGFRMNIPFSVFTATGLVFLMYHGISSLKIKHNIAFLLIFLLTLIPMMRNIYYSYVYIPYSNSIPYIFSKHKFYGERINYNINAFTERTGESIYNKE